MENNNYRRFRNKRSKAIISVDEKEIKELVELYDVLKIPVNCSTIRNSEIEYVKHSVHEINDLKDFVFLFNCDLTKDLKSLFITYYGCLAIYLDDSQFYDEDERHDAIVFLEEQFRRCLKKASTVSQFLTKIVFKDIILTDYNTRTNWELLEDDKLKIV